MLDGNMDKIRSEAALLGWLGRSADSVAEMAKAKVELEYLERSAALRAIVSTLEARLDRMRKRSERKRERLNMLMAERSLSAPFEWMLGKMQLAFIVWRTRRLKRALDNARSELGQLREQASARITELENEIRLAYEQGKSLRELGTQDFKVEEKYDVL